MTQPQTLDDSLQTNNDTVDKGRPSVDEVIPIAKLLEYRQRDMSLEEIATLVGCSRQNVWNRLKDYKADIEGLEAYKSRKSDVLHLVGSQLVGALTPKVIKEMKGRDLAVAYGVLYDKAALEDGKPTAMIAYSDLCAGSEDVEARLKELGVIDISSAESSEDSPHQEIEENAYSYMDGGENGQPTGVQEEEDTPPKETTPHPRTPGGDIPEE